jgi:RAB protein geranylgeranyltransferase component A
MSSLSFTKENSMEFDYCILGTGIACAILSGALSKDGASVLILDRSDYYANSHPLRLAGKSIAENQGVIRSNGALVSLLIQSGGIAWIF